MSKKIKAPRNYRLHSAANHSTAALPIPDGERRTAKAATTARHQREPEEKDHENGSTRVTGDFDQNGVNRARPGKDRIALTTSPYLSQDRESEHKSNRIPWDKVIEEVKRSLSWFQEKRITPSLRTMFYRLFSLEVIPNTEQTYKSLSRQTVRARKKGEIPWDSFSDDSRQVLTEFQYEYRTPEEYVELGIDFLKNASRSYTIPRWYKQPNYVEVWIEKLALANTFLSFLKTRQVAIVVNKGYPGWSFLHDNCIRLRKIIENEQKDVHVLYFGDFDPSGQDMDRHIRNAINTFGLTNRVHFQRVAVTLDQIRQFNLPPRPEDKETIDKVERDTRKVKFIQQYGQLYVVELDALLAIVPEEFRDIIQNSVDQYFDPIVWDDVQSRHSASRLDRLVRQKVRFMDGS